MSPPPAARPWLPRPAAGAPWQARAAGLATAAEGAAGLVYAVLVLARAVAGAGDRSALQLAGEVGYFGILGMGVALAGSALVLGRRWGRSPALVIQILLLGVAWYTAGPSGRLVAGAVLGAFCLLVAVLLLVAPVRAWAYSGED